MHQKNQKKKVGLIFLHLFIVNWFLFLNDWMRDPTKNTNELIYMNS